MLLKIGLGFLALLVIFVAYIALQSPDYVVSREVSIQASAEKIFPYLNNPRLAEQWAPWPEVDPKAKMNHTGPEQGLGAVTSWDSDGQLGTGSATIVESIPNQKVVIRLSYTKPMNMEQTAEYLVQASGNQTVVTWRVTGKNSFLGRFMCFFFNMDKMVGGMFEQGLGKLKMTVEKSA